MPATTAIVFDAAFDLMKANLAQIVLLSALFLLPAALLQQYLVSHWLAPSIAALSPDVNDADLIPYLFLNICYVFTGVPKYSVPGLFTLAASVLASAPIAVAVGQAITGRQMHVIGSLRTALSQSWRILCGIVLALSCCMLILILVSVLVGIIATFCTIALGFAFAGSPDSTLAAVLLFIMVIISVAIPYVVTWLFYGRIFAFVVPVMVNEHRGVLDSIARSQELVRPVKFRSTIFSFALLPLLVAFMQGAVTYGVDSALGQAGLSEGATYLVKTALTALTVCVFQAYWMVFVARLYFDYRMARECFDIRLMEWEQSAV